MTIRVQAARTSLWTLCSVPFVMVLSNSMLIPVLPAMQRAMDLSPFHVGLVITAFSLPAGLVIPLGGYLSDRLGRKAVMVPALFLFGLGGLLAGASAALAAAPFLPILGGRVLQGVGGGGLYQIAMALAGDLFPPRERPRALGLLEAANGLGKVAAPILGAAVAQVAWHAPYFVYPALAWPAAAAVWFLVREPPRQRERRPSPREYLRDLWRTWHRRGVSLLAAFAAGMVTLLLLFGILSYYSDVLESRWRVTGLGKGLVMAVPVLAMSATAYLAGVFLQQHLRRWSKAAVTAGLALGAAGLMAALGPARGLVPFSAAMAALGLGAGLVLPAVNSLVTGAVGAAERGMVTALYGSVRFFGTAIGPPAAGRAAAAGPAAVLGGGAALAVLAAAAVLLFLRQRALAEPDQGDAA